MPIRKSQRHLYPKDWPAIRERILLRAGNACEQCRVPNHAIICRGEGSDAGTYMMEDGEVRDEETGEYQYYARGSEYEGRVIAVVLTCAHFDHDPTNNHDGNLRAWCQLHHLRHDKEQHARNAAATRARKRDEETGQQTMFGDDQ
jgi:hypothetical protein